MNKYIAQNLIDKTRQDYNRISAHFSSTRSYMWPDIGRAIEGLQLKKGDKVLDLGCGNGRILPLLSKSGIEYTGADISEKLIEIAKRDYHGERFVVANITKLPFPDKEFDSVITIATLHHIPRKEQETALAEIKRVLKPRGKLLISVWYFWNQPKYLKLIIVAGLKKLMGKNQLDFGDFLLEWQTSNKKVKVERYFHAFRKKELLSLLETDFTKIKKQKSERNLIFSARKK